MSSYPNQDDDSCISVFDAVKEKPGSTLSKQAITSGCFSKIFSGIGQFPIEPVSIVFSEDAEPVQPAHRVLVALKEKVKQELKSMEKTCIISKLDRNTPTPWLNSYVIIKKPNGSLGICLDPTDLNKYIGKYVTLTHWMMLAICSRTQNTSVFLMLQRFFFHLPMDAMSRPLTAMLTPEGVYVFNILAIGLCNAGDLFESPLCELLSGLPGITNITDDILVYGSTQEEHDTNVICFLE